MAISTLLSQARAGNAQAIAQLMNQQLQSRELIVQAIREGDCLRLRLSGKRLLSEAGFVAYVRQSLGRLACPHLERVEIVAQEQGQLQPLWRVAIALQPALAREAVRVGGEPFGAADGTAIASPTRPAPAISSVRLAMPRPRPMPMPRRRTIAWQWFTASLWASFGTLAITVSLSLLLMPLVASMTGMAQFNGFALVILLAMQLIIGIPLGGLLIGYAQTRILRRYLRAVGGWQLITPLGCLLGFFIAMIVHFVGHTAFNLAGWMDSLGQADTIWGEALSIACTTLGVGLGFGFLGLAQFAILSGRLHKAQRWIVMLGGSGMAAWLVGVLFWRFAPPGLGDVARSLHVTPLSLSMGLAVLLGWLVFQGLSAVFLAYLMQPNGRGSNALG